MDQIIEKEGNSNVIKPRNGFIAFLLSLLLPGLGQVYNGQLKKGTIFFGLILLSPIIYGLTVSVISFYTLCSLLIIETSLRIYNIIDAIIYSKRQKKYVLKPYNRWYYHLIIGIGMAIVLMIYDTNTVLGAQAYKIPTTSNSPTFQINDWVMADMKAYSKNDPKCGDLVVYTGDDGQNYILRVVGLPNDNIELIDNIPSINGITSKSIFVKETEDKGIPVKEFEEELPNGHTHLIYKFHQPYDSTKANIKEAIVPENHYYLLGDNRDNVFDSRFYGFINKSRIKGKIIFSYWGETLDRVNIDITNK
jgi:signal peptidase I